jgi:excisionase family DNA binding protein
MNPEPNPLAPLLKMIADAASERLQAGQPDRLLTVEAAAAYLGRTPAALRHLIATKVIPVVREGRSVHLDRRELDRWIEMRQA